MDNTLCGALLLLAIVLTNSETTDRKEYCHDETMALSCKPSEVILMVSASYGRMKLGRCVTTDLGYLGCTRDALPFLDSRCSGRQQCEISVMDAGLRVLQPCLKDVSWYLLAAHRCVKVSGHTSLSAHHCHQQRHVPLTNSSGYISSVLASGSNLGSPRCPFRISVGQGQGINLTVYNFLPSYEPGSGGCHEVAVVRVGTKRQIIKTCLSHPRKVLFHSFKNNAIDIHFIGSGAQRQNLAFLLYYEATGCRTMKAPPGAHLSRDEDNLLVKCNSTGETWYLVCLDGTWKGKIGSCTATAMSIERAEEEQFPFGLLIVVAIGVALGVFLGGTALILVSLYMKRRQRRQESVYTEAPPPIENMENMLAEDQKLNNMADYETKESSGYYSCGGRQSTRVDSNLSSGRMPKTAGPEYGTSLSSYQPRPGSLSHFYESPQFP